MPLSRERRRVTNPKGSVFASPKAVVQNHFKNQSDINLIVERARKGIMPSNVRQPGQYLDVSDTAHTLDEAFARVERAWEAFDSLPSGVRAELDNDPRKLLAAGKDFYEKHGLLMSKEDAVAVSPGRLQESEGARPSEKDPKGPNKASKKPKVDDDSQD